MGIRSQLRDQYRIAAGYGLTGLVYHFIKTSNVIQTPIEYDMRVHLLDGHRKELITHLPIGGRGFDMNYRRAFVIDFIKGRKLQEFYNHRTVKFAPLKDM
jgi:hypothetical protein